MAFPQQTPRPYTRRDIEKLTVGQRGCYGIVRKNNDGSWTWIYVGKGDDIRARMLEHVNGDNPRITRKRPTHWVGMVTNDNDDEEKRLILALNPVANRKVG